LKRRERIIASLLTLQLAMPIPSDAYKIGSEARTSFGARSVKKIFKLTCCGSVKKIFKLTCCSFYGLPLTWMRAKSSNSLFHVDP